MKIKNPETGEVIVIPQGMEDAVRDAIESGNDPMEAMQMKYGGIHINPANKGKFNATKKATGKTTEELTHSKNPLTRKRAIFAQNASRWKHQDGGQAMQQQQPQGGGQQDQMQQLIQMAEQALAQGASPEEVAQMLIQQGVPEQVVQQVIQYAIQDLQQQQQAQGQNPEEQMQQQNPQEEQAEMGYGGMSMYDDGGMAMYGNGGGIDNPGFRALPDYVQQDIINNMRTGGKFLRKAGNGIRYNRVARRAAPLFPDGPVLENNNSFATNPSLGNKTNTPGSMASPIGTYSTDNQPFGAPTNIDNGMSSMGSSGVGGSSVGGSNIGNNVGSNNSNNVGGMGSGIFGMSNNTFGGIGSGNNMGSAPGGSMGSGAPFWSGTGGGNNTPLYGPENQPAPFWGVSQTNGAATAATTPSGNTKLSSFDKYNKGLSNITGGNSYFGRGIQHLGQATFDFTKGGLEMAGANISNRNALGDEANNLRSAMRNDYKKVGKRPTDGNSILQKYGGKMMQDGGATYADKMKVSKNSPKADFIAEKGEYIVNNGVASKLETGGSHASGNDTAISLDKSSNPSYVLSDTPRLKQLQFGGKRVSPSKYAEMATVEALGKTPDQILKAYTAFTKRAGTEGKVFGDRISDATNQLLAQKYQKDLATVKQIADQAYHKQEQLKHAMGMDNDLDHAQEVNGMSMAKSGGMQDGVHMNYFNAPAVQYGGSPQLFSDPSELGYNTTQMGYGGLHKMQLAGKAPPVYLSDPNDPRIRMYSDSLAQFNTTKPFINEINRQNRTGVYDNRKLDQLQANNIRTFSTNPLYDSKGNVIGQSSASQLPESTKNMYPTRTRTQFTSTPRPGSSENLVQPWRVDSYKEPTNPYLYRPEEEEVESFAKGDEMYYPQISSSVSNGQPITAQPKDYVTITESQGRRNPATGAFEKQTYKIDRVTGKRISEPEFTKQNGGMYRMAGGGNALNTTRQQSQIDYDKQYGVKTNTGDVGVDKYADIQNKSKIGFGKAEENLKSFSQWKDIYPGYNDLMTEINKKGGPGKDNAKVGDFQNWFNSDYIPQQIEKLNTERTAAGETAYDATQLAQLKTDLINDYGFDDTTGQRVDSDFGAYTSSRTPINFSFNKKKEEEKKKEDEVITGDEPVVPKLTIDKEEEEPDYDFPAINAFIPQPYGRNPIGLAQAQPQTIRPAKLNIQPELNEYNRGMRGAFRGTQGNTSVNVAQQMQGLNNLYGAQNKLYGQKYNFDEQSRMGAEQFNAQAIMNTDAGNLQRIGVQQDLINRREGALDTQRRKDFQKGMENVQKENAYGLSKEYIEDVFGPYINNKGKIDLTQVPRTTTSKDKEKTYTRAEYDKMIAAEKKAIEPQRYGGSLKKIKLKLRK